MNIPAPLQKAFQGGLYESPNDLHAHTVSVTTLIGPARIPLLRERHPDIPPEPPEATIAALIGTGLHLALEQLTEPPARAEVRLTAPIPGTRWTLSGATDLYEPPGVLWDFKSTKAVAMLYGSKPDWERQLNLLAFLWRYHHCPVVGLRVAHIGIDWSAAELKKAQERKGRYPLECVQVYEIPLWPAADVEAYAKGRALAFDAALESLPACTDEERWARVDKSGKKIFNRCGTGSGGYCPCRSVCDQREIG